MKNKVIKIIFNCLVSLFVVILSIKTVDAAWIYFDKPVTPASYLIDRIRLGKFNYGPVVKPDYDHDFGDGTIADQDNQDAFEQIMGDKKDQPGDYIPNTDVGLNNPGSDINKILDENMDKGDLISSIDGPGDKGNKNRALLDPNLGREVSFLMVKETSKSDKYYRTYNLYTTTTPLFSTTIDKDGNEVVNDYINGKPLFKMGDVIPEVYKAELKWNYDLLYGQYEVVKSEKGYCTAGSIKTNPGLPFINANFTQWTHGANYGIEIKGPEPHITNFGAQFQLTATSGNGISNFDWVSSDTNVATVDANGLVTVTNNEFNYNSKSVDIKAVAGDNYGIYSFKIDIDKLDSERKMYQGIILSQDGKTIVSSQSRNADLNKRYTLYTSDFLPQGMDIYTDGRVKTKKFIIKSKDKHIDVRIQYIKNGSNKVKDIVTLKDDRVKKTPGKNPDETIYEFKTDRNIYIYKIAINSSLVSEFELIQ